jgi:hypothetical protein
VAAGAAVGLAGCGEERTPAGNGDLVWSKEPLLFKSSPLPRDRILLGTVRNRSKHDLHLVAAKVSIRDADGKPLQSWAQFIPTFAHGLYGAFQKPNPLPPGELTRLGLVITLPPGASAPLSASWRLTARTRTPVRIDYGTGTLPVPSRTRAQHPSKR